MNDRYCLVSTVDGVYFAAGAVREVDDAIRRCGWFDSDSGRGYVEDVLFRDESIRWIRSESDGVVISRLRNLAL